MELGAWRAVQAIEQILCIALGVTWNSPEGVALVSDKTKGAMVELRLAWQLLLEST